MRFLLFGTLTVTMVGNVNCKRFHGFPTNKLIKCEKILTFTRNCV